MPKTLLPFGQGTILSQILYNFRAVGVREFVIVTGFRGDSIAEYLDGRRGEGEGVTLVENREWERGNGVSAHAARPHVGDGPFLLSMSDHLVSPAALRALHDRPSSSNLLLVDPRVDNVVHLDDATKVCLDGGGPRISRIGKDLTEFNAIDCGVFRLDGRFFDAMSAQMTRKKDSLSDGMRLLIERRAFEGVPMPPGADWIDIDTLEAYEYALAHHERFV